MVLYIIFLDFILTTTLDVNTDLTTVFLDMSREFPWATLLGSKLQTKCSHCLAGSLKNFI